MGQMHNEDFGREEITAQAQDRYQFRTSPLRNVAVQATFMHNGAFTRLEDAVRYHLAASENAHTYQPTDQQLDPDLTGPIGPIDPVIANLDPALTNPIYLTDRQFDQLIAFVRCGLLDPRARPANLRKLIPTSLPSKRPPLHFEFQPTEFVCRVNPLDQRGYRLVADTRAQYPKAR